jgi:hypothetical protein
MNGGMNIYLKEFSNELEYSQVKHTRSGDWLTIHAVSAYFDYFVMIPLQSCSIQIDINPWTQRLFGKEKENRLKTL